MSEFDTIIVGGGMAGLSAGLWLARYRRSVRVLDSGKPRNDPTWAVHGYPGITDPAPHELRRVLIEQARVAGAQWQDADVVSVIGEKNAFRIGLENAETLAARRVVLAYGRQDVLPQIEGLERLYGVSVFHCPDCDGPSMVDARIGVIGWRRGAALQALYLLAWTRSVTLLTNGHQLALKPKAVATLAKYDVAINSKPIARLCEQDDRLTAVEFVDGDALPLDSAFFYIGSHPSSDLADQLGCTRDEDDNVVVDNAQETSVAGVFAAGDLTGPPYLAVSAAASGVKAAIAAHKSLLPADQQI
ncbi:MAG: NAD(P)/FAD-dependent oxidoreductase [Gemmatimonadota bacterium]